MTTRARAIRLREHGGPEVLRLEDLTLADPGPGEILVRHTAIGVNFIDVYHRSGLYPSQLPAGLGQEAVGEVLAVGGGVADVRVGDRVGYCTAPGAGAYATHRLVPAASVVELPPFVDDARAASALLKGMTAEYLVRRAFKVHVGNHVLFHAAAGGVGTLACQWLAHLGAVVIGTVGAEAKVEVARANGCAHVIVYTREDFVARVRELTGGRGVDVAYDSVGKATLAGSLETLAVRGTLVSFGNASGKPDPVDPLTLSARGSVYLTRPKLGDYARTREELRASAAALFAVIQSGAVEVAPPRTMPLSEVAAAHRALEARATTGSIVLLP